MKPTIEQQQYLKGYLREGLQYRETYAEFYDHILTALEAQPDEISFHDAVKNIVAEDFGGFAGMSVIEARYKKQTIKEMQKRYLNYTIGYLKFPAKIILIVSSIIVYYLVKQLWFNFYLLIGIYLIITLTPSLLNALRYFKAGYIFSDKKESVKDDGFTWMKYIPGMLFSGIVCIIWLCRLPISIESIKEPLVITIVFMIQALHTLSFYKIYQEEFKVNIAQ